MKTHKIILEAEQGKFLVSEPFLTDPYFKRTVVLLSEHNQTGTVGFILNKITNLKLNETIKDFPEFNVPIYFGGPVGTDTLHYIHKLGDRLPGSKEICKGIYWGGDFEILRTLIDTKQVTSDYIRFFVGYSGWELSQLNTELRDRSWFISTGNEKIAFAETTKGLWSQVMKSMGDEYAVISTFQEEYLMN
jgi:putative transcriptional regulator